MEDPVSLSDTEDYSLADSSMLQTSHDHQDYLIMTIELGDGQQEHIKIHSSDDPIQLAHNFIQSHQLSSDLEESLANLIKQNIGLLDKRSQPIPLFKSSLSNYNSSAKDPNQFRPFEVPSITKHTPQINKKSLMITARQSRGDIHERLYKLAARKKQKEKLARDKERESLDIHEKTTPSFYNPGEILYIKGMAMQHSRKRLTEETEKEKEAALEKQLTFKPCINPGERRYDEKPEDVLWKKGKEYEVHKKVLKEKFAREEIKHCSFQPNPDKNKNSDRKVHEELYKESYVRLEKMNELANKKLFPFEPNSDKPKTERTESQDDFIDRLYNSKQKLYEEMEKLRNLQQFNYDPYTGQKLFRPEVNKNHEASTRKQDKNIWQYLYQMKDTKKENIRKLLKEEEKYWKENANSSKLGTMSQKVFEKFRFKQYKKLFECMDSDKDGYISADSIDLNSIESKKLEVLSPLLEHLLNSGDDIDFSTFSQHLEQLRDHLDLAQKDLILSRDRKVEMNEIDPHPMLNPNTIEIYERIRPDEGLYERGVKEKIVNQLRNEKKKQLREEELVKDCSFKPTLVTGGKVGYSIFN